MMLPSQEEETFNRIWAFWLAVALQMNEAARRRRSHSWIVRLFLAASHSVSGVQTGAEL